MRRAALGALPSAMAITFAVDDVTARRTPLPTIALADALHEMTGVAIFQPSHEAALVAPGRDAHPLVQAVHLAFSEHRPLSLSPDHVWLTLSQGFAIHVDQNAEALRSRFVRHEGRARIEVNTTAEPATSAEWAEVVGAFGQGVAEHVGPGLHRLLACSFSTTGERERVASEIVMMAAFRRYFDYVLKCICGIPEVTLEGSADDWAEIRRRAEVLVEYDLGFWAAALLPILDELLKSARGAPDRSFWRAIYKPADAYGGDVATGWIMRLFPYLESNDGTVGRNPAVTDLPWPIGSRRWISKGVSPSSAPRGLSRANVRIERPDAPARTVSLYGGFAGVRQIEGGALRPEVGWAVGAPPRMTGLVDRILAEHKARPPLPPTSDDWRLERPADLLEMDQRCDGAVLFGRWNILPRAERHTLVGSLTEGFLGADRRSPHRGGYTPTESIPVEVLCAIEGDPRFFAVFHGRGFPVVLCDPRRAAGPEEILVVADDVATFVEQILEHHGAFWFEGRTAPSVYTRFDHHDHLRRALTVGPHAPPTDLDAREKERLVALLRAREGAAEQRAFWWEALRGATGTTRSYEELFGPRACGYQAVLEELGLRPPRDTDPD